MQTASAGRGPISSSATLGRAVATAGLLWLGLGGQHDAWALTPPPELPREFRGAWVATVANIDWPSKPGLPVDEQQQEMIKLLDLARDLHLNAIILQVRPAADALYGSNLEPWSQYLTGIMGQAPEPLYDPLQFAVEQAHQRGLELHAWFNPYRARHASAHGEVANNHISRTHPEIVRQYGGYLWLDPGEPSATEHTRQVVLDVVRRYDIDGVHFDDYFYPYPVTDEGGQEVPFPDDASWERRKDRELSRDDWRRDNVSRFIQSLYADIKSAKPWVKFGISPFGIWRPGQPPSITGFDAYAKLYADAKLWQEQGWLDYLTPQLYWKIDSAGQSYPVLLEWWYEHNARDRHLWPGNFTSRLAQQQWRLARRGDHRPDPRDSPAGPRPRQCALQHEGLSAKLRRHCRPAETGALRRSGTAYRPAPGWTTNAPLCPPFRSPTEPDTASLNSNRQMTPPPVNGSCKRMTDRRGNPSLLPGTTTQYALPDEDATSLETPLTIELAVTAVSRTGDPQSTTIARCQASPVAGTMNPWDGRPRPSPNQVCFRATDVEVRRTVITMKPRTTIQRSPWWWVPTLYFAEGIPYVVVMTVAVVMYKRLGISNTSIALYTSWLYLPWVIKPFWSPLVDVLRTKRFWILAMQLLIGAGLAGIALTIPASNFFRYTLAFLWLLAFSSATHDIAADGFYLLGLSTHDQAWFVGIRSTAYRLAMIAGQGLLIMLAGSLESWSGLPDVAVHVAARPDGPQLPTWQPAAILFPDHEETAAILSSPPRLEIGMLPQRPEDVSRLREQIRVWNVEHGFYADETAGAGGASRPPGSDRRGWSPWRISYARGLARGRPRRPRARPRGMWASLISDWLNLWPKASTSRSTWAVPAAARASRWWKVNGLRSRPPTRGTYLRHWCRSTPAWTRRAKPPYGPARGTSPWPGH